MSPLSDLYNKNSDFSSWFIFWVVGWVDNFSELKIAVANYERRQEDHLFSNLNKILVISFDLIN
jgi:hypothetical protein